MSVSAEEVAKHNKDSDCWVIVGDQVLDVTNFLSRLEAVTCWVNAFEQVLDEKETACV